MSEMVKYKGSVLIKRRKSGPVYHHLWHSPSWKRLARLSIEGFVQFVYLVFTFTWFFISLRRQFFENFVIWQVFFNQIEKEKHIPDIWRHFCNCASNKIEKSRHDTYHNFLILFFRFWARVMNSILYTMVCHTLEASEVWVTFASSKLVRWNSKKIVSYLFH